MNKQHDETEPDQLRTNSWSVNLEKSRYQNAPERAIRDGIAAIEQTAAGYHVNLVTHATLGQPDGFLFPALAQYDERQIEWEYITQCGCGGHVTRVHVK